MTTYLTIAEARDAPGLRLACLRGVPSPWTEAAKGIFHVKRLDYRRAAVGPEEAQTAIADWAGDASIPVVACENEALRTGWAEILLLAERLAPAPALIPEAAADRARLFGLAHEICGEMGFGWSYRLLMIQASLSHDDDQPGFPPDVAGYLGAKYGFAPQALRQARQRVLDVLGLLDAQLEGHRYLLGDTLTAIDIYWATFANLVTPLPEDELPALPMIRAAYTARDPDVLAAVSDRLRRHQRFVYDHHLELPVAL